MAEATGGGGAVRGSAPAARDSRRVDAAAGRRQRHSPLATRHQAKRWEPPQDATTRCKALTGSRDAAFDPTHAPWLKQCLLQCCTPLSVVDGSDWLAKGQPGDANGDRKGQSFAQFCRPGPRRSFPSKFCSKIYLTALGPMQKDAPDISVLVECLRAHFQMDVVVGSRVAGEDFEAIEKASGCGYGEQLEAPRCAELLASRKPRDCFAHIGFTMNDITNSEKGYGFLFGQADLDNGVGIFSFARYASDSPELFLRRCCMVLVHEMTHLFGIKHCIHAECVMNGSNHLGESDRRPFAVCPVCTAKFRDSMRSVWPATAAAVAVAGTARARRKAGGAGRAGGAAAQQPPEVKEKEEDPLLRRERDVLQFLERHGMKDDAQLSRERLQIMMAGGNGS